jgi:hypothetical protein
VANADTSGANSSPVAAQPPHEKAEQLPPTQPTLEQAAQLPPTGPPKAPAAAKAEVPCSQPAPKRAGKTPKKDAVQDISEKMETHLAKMQTDMSPSVMWDSKVRARDMKKAIDLCQELDGKAADLASCPESLVKLGGQLIELAEEAQEYMDLYTEIKKGTPFVMMCKSTNPRPLPNMLKLFNKMDAVLFGKVMCFLGAEVGASACKISKSDTDEQHKALEAFFHLLTTKDASADSLPSGLALASFERDVSVLEPIAFNIWSSWFELLMKKRGVEGLVKTAWPFMSSSQFLLRSFLLFSQ